MPAAPIPPIDPERHPIYRELRGYLLQEVAKWCRATGYARSTLAGRVLGRGHNRFFDQLEAGKPLQAHVVDRFITHMEENSAYTTTKATWKNKAPSL